MRFIRSVALLYFLVSSAATAAINPAFDNLPADLDLSSGELSAAGCTSGLCNSGGRIAPADDPVFQFANAAASETAAPVIAARSAPGRAAGPVPAGIGSVPEPQTYALLCGGLLLLGGLARRRPRP
jgi:hypothetical protein